MSRPLADFKGRRRQTFEECADIRAPTRTTARPHPGPAGEYIIAMVIAIAAGAGPCAALAADYGVIAEQNLFDPERKPWPEPAAAAAPAAGESPLGPDDLEVQGVVVHGGVKRAIVRLGSRLRALAPGADAGRYNVILREGQALGGYTLESVGAQQLVFVSAGKRIAVPFTRSARREVASAVPAPLPVIQSATLPVTAPTSVPAARPTRRSTRRTTARSTTEQQAAASGAPAAQTGAATPVAPATSPAAAPADGASQGGMTLLQAIQAAEAARRSGQAPAAPPYNPFAPRSP